MATAIGEGTLLTPATPKKATRGRNNSYDVFWLRHDSLPTTACPLLDHLNPSHSLSTGDNQ